MTETKKYTVRPCKNQRTDLRDAFRVHFSTNTLSLLRLNAGDLCNIITSDNRSLPAKAWPAVDKVMDSIVMTTKTLQEAYNLHLGDQVTISRSENPASDAAAEEIVVEEIPDTDHGNPPAYRDKEDKTHWSSLLRYHACQAQELCPGVVFKSIRSIGEQRSFRVVRINDSHDLGLYSSKHTKIVRIQDNAQSAAVQTGILEITNELIGGLNSQIDQINKILRPYSNCGIEFKKNARHRTRRGGIILHGPHGTGKSMILGEIVKAGWNRVLHITRNTISLPKTSRTEAVQKIFTNANDHQPSVVIIDDLDKFAGKTNLLDDQHSLHIAPSLQEAFDQREDNRVLVVAATNRLANIVPDLRRRGRFEYEIEITVPNTQSRKEILKLLCGLPATSSHLQLEALAERTHGYVGDDLEGLLQVASDHTAVGNPEGSMWDLAEQDIESALNVVRPTTMKEAIRGLPKVKWSDIAGSDDLKKKFEHVVASFKVCLRSTSY